MRLRLYTFAKQVTPFTFVLVLLDRLKKETCYSYCLYYPSHCIYLEQGVETLYALSIWKSNLAIVLLPQLIFCNSVNEKVLFYLTGRLVVCGEGGARSDRGPGPDVHSLAWPQVSGPQALLPERWLDSTSALYSARSRPATSARWLLPAPQLTPHQRETGPREVRQPRFGNLLFYTQTKYFNFTDNSV